MKKETSIIIALVAIVIVAGGGYALFHKSPKPSGTSNSTTSSSQSATTASNAVLITKSNAGLGQYLAKPNGQPLYTFGGDSNGVSNCTGSCLASWPAYQDTGATTGLPANVSTLKRTDNGETQFTYNGMPLYTFVGDSNGQVTGNGVSNFTIAKPSTAPASSSTPTSTPTPSSSSTNQYNSNTPSGSGW